MENTQPSKYYDYSWKLPFDGQCLNFLTCTTLHVIAAATMTGLILYGAESTDWTPGIVTSLTVGISLNFARKLSYYRQTQNKKSYYVAVFNFTILIGATYFITDKALKGLGYKNIHPIDIAKLGSFSAIGITLFNRGWELQKGWE